MVLYSQSQCIGIKAYLLYNQKLQELERELFYNLRLIIIFAAYVKLLTSSQIHTFLEHIIQKTGIKLTSNIDTPPVINLKQYNTYGTIIDGGKRYVLHDQQ